MENVVIIDSDILIDYIKNKEDACQTLFNLEQEYRVATTVMNVYELLYGAKKVKNSSMKVKAMQSMIYQMVILDMDFEAAVHASEIMHDLEKRGEFIDIKDALIASIALRNDVPIKTNNKKHFSRIKGLKLI